LLNKTALRELGLRCRRFSNSVTNEMVFMRLLCASDERRITLFSCRKAYPDRAAGAPVRTPPRLIWFAAVLLRASPIDLTLAMRVALC
jgi:hypothetical protein